MTRKRAGLVGLFGAALLLLAVEPAAAQTSSSVTERLIWELNGNLLYVAVPITVLVEGILIYTVWRFARSDEAKPTQENRRLEITWTVATAVILLFVGVASYQVVGNPFVTASAQVEQPEQVEQVDVIGQKYLWTFEYTFDAEGVSANGLTLDGVDVEGARVVNDTADGAVVAGGQLSGPTLTSATLESGVVAGVNASEGETVSLSDVTVSDANVTDATITNATVTNSNTMVVPTERRLRLNVTSRDVLHSFHVPGLGLKADAFPAQSNYLVTRITETGTYQLYCAEYCGVGHSNMLGTVEAVPQEEYRQWLVDKWASAQS
ncbi:MAG: cytochrome c oxidase subunit II [Halorientalis sp.]